MCERCEAPLDESMSWCTRCFFTAPWASTLAETDPTDTSEWPNIWDHAPGWAPPTDWRDPEWEAMAESISPTPIAVWPLRKVVVTVAMLLSGAALTAMFIPEQVVGLVALVTFGAIALFVVRQAWGSQPYSG